MHTCTNLGLSGRIPVSVRVAVAPGKGLGLFLAGHFPAPPGAFLLEITGGHTWGWRQARSEMAAAGRRGDRHLYLFPLGISKVLDASHRGNVGRFVNHR